MDRVRRKQAGHNNLLRRNRERLHRTTHSQVHLKATLTLGMMKTKQMVMQAMAIMIRRQPVMPSLMFGSSCQRN